MSATEIHGAFGIEAGTTLLPITQQDAALGTEIRSETPSGQISPRILSITRQQPVVNFTTHKLASALAALPLAGKSVADISGGLNFYGYKRQDASSFAGGAVHRKYGVAKGIVIPMALAVNHQGDATLSYQAVITYDGVNAPIVLTEDVAIPSGLEGDERFTLGPITLGNIAFTHVRSLNIDFGIEVRREGADGEIWDRFVTIHRVAPVITVRGVGLEWFKASGGVPITGLQATHANTLLYLRKWDPSGSAVLADGVAQHVKFTACGVVVVDPPFDADTPTDTAEAGLRLECRDDETNAPIVATLNQAIA
jgi:hypothetical protein